MTKSDIIDAICEEIGLSNRESARIVESLFDIVKEILEDGENVKLSGFGSFNHPWYWSPEIGQEFQEQISFFFRNLVSAVLCQPALSLGLTEAIR